MGDEGNPKEAEGDKKIVHTYPLVKVGFFSSYFNICLHQLQATKLINIIHLLTNNFQHSDMVEEMKSECVELSITACEKFATNYEVNFFLFLFIQKRVLFSNFCVYFMCLLEQ